MLFFIYPVSQNPLYVFEFIKISTDTQSHLCLLLQNKVFCKNVHRWLCLPVEILIETLLKKIISLKNWVTILGINHLA